MYGGGCRFVVEGRHGGRSFFFSFFFLGTLKLEEGLEKRGSDRVVLEGLWDLCFRAI